MKNLLSDGKYSFISQQDKDFILAFDNSMIEAGYANNDIQPYVVFGKYKIEYYKPGTKTKKYIARIYFRDDGIVLRLYLSNIDKHSVYIENAPDFIQEPFVSDAHNCKKPNCKGMITNGKCRYIKTYTLKNAPHIKCAEQAFIYYGLDVKDVAQYIELLVTFYPIKQRVQNGGNP
jgi:hypothetical protein